MAHQVSPLAPAAFPELPPIAGVRLAAAETGIRYKNRPDVLMALLDPGTTVAGCFTMSKSRSAPVDWCAANLGGGSARAVIINAGNANAFTGKAGVATVTAVAKAAAHQLKCKAGEIFQASTGVIGEPLNPDFITGALGQLAAEADPDRWSAAAHAIMTTDTVAKAASRRIELGGKIITVTGISKGAGMIRPNMATMLGFVATDAGIPAGLLAQLAKDAADQSFNCITVDGDTSTNDSFVVISTGAAGLEVDAASPHWAALRAAVIEVAQELAQAIVRDGEGATKFISVKVGAGGTAEECRKVAYAIGHSPLVKTAFFASDPNLGRILAAIGYAGIDDLDAAGVRVWLGSGDEEVLVSEHGGRAASYREDDGSRIMKNAEITVRVDLGRGSAAAIVWTCDFSYDYVKINADYRS